jgi:methylmalonyl-CoA mutase cobalamin-binding subunit
MPESQQSAVLASRDRADDRGDGRASQAMALVARRPDRFGRPLDGRFVALLHEAALATGPDSFAPVLRRMRDSGLCCEEIADRYIPEVARAMGALWCEDRMSFAAVTIGVSRLQMLLRDLGPEWRGDSLSDPDSPAILVLVASDSYHTLGATLLAGQLRRRGLSVRVLIGARPEQIGPVMRQIGFDAVLVSASLGESLENLRRLLDAVKTSVGNPPPVVLGGTILETENLSADAIRALTGADHVTSDPGEALKLCGLKTTTRNGAARAERS